MPLSHFYFFLIIHHIQYFGWLDRTDIIAVFVHVDGVGTPMGGQQSGQNCENGGFYNPYYQRENILKIEFLVAGYAAL